MGYDNKQNLKDNVAAIHVAVEWKHGEVFLPEQIALLKRQAGFGVSKAVPYPNAPKEEQINLKASKGTLRLYPEIIELHHYYSNISMKQLKRQAIDSINNSIVTAF